MSFRLAGKDVLFCYVYGILYIKYLIFYCSIVLYSIVLFFILHYLTIFSV